MNWNPVRRGDIYCSPACGGKCTWAAYQYAKLKARALADRLGPQWRPRVWENIGWHYTAVTDRLEVSEYNRRRYSAHVQPGDFWTYASTPKAAVAKMIADVRKHAADILKLVEGL